MLYCPIGTTQAASGAYDWLERLLQDEDQTDAQYQALDEATGSVPPGTGGILFLPYWNPLARAAFVGLAMPHSRAEMAPRRDGRGSL